MVRNKRRMHLTYRRLVRLHMNQHAHPTRHIRNVTHHQFVNNSTFARVHVVLVNPTGPSPHHRQHHRATTRNPRRHHRTHTVNSLTQQRIQRRSTRHQRGRRHRPGPRRRLRRHSILRIRFVNRPNTRRTTRASARRHTANRRARVGLIHMFTSRKQRRRQRGPS